MPPMSRARRRAGPVLTSSKRCRSTTLAAVLSLSATGTSGAGAHAAFVTHSAAPSLVAPPPCRRSSRLSAQQGSEDSAGDRSLLGRWLPSLEDPGAKSRLEKGVATLFTTLGFSALFLTNPLLPVLPLSHYSSAHAEDELYAKYGGKGLDTSLVDKDCLVNQCSRQAKACLQDDPDCRKGLTCTAKCLGDNACITGCFARYGDSNLDGLLKCTIEDNDCIKVAILEGGADQRGEEPASPAPTVQGFDLRTMEGSWYKVAGYNPNYDCYACQRNTFSAPEGGLIDGLNDQLATLPHANARVPAGGLLGGALGQVGADRLQVDVEFSMPRMLDDGSPPPPSGVRETLEDGAGMQSVGYNQYATHETMVFDREDETARARRLVLGEKGQEKSYARTAHSEGEMFGLSESLQHTCRPTLRTLSLTVFSLRTLPEFWENWYIIGQSDPGQPDDFKFVYYNGKTRQNTYDGAFVYSRSRSLSPAAMEKVYRIAADAGMNPDQFCKINNGCFEGAEEAAKNREVPPREGLGSPSNPFRGILASTKVSELLGVESVAAESIPSPLNTIVSDYLQPTGRDEADVPTKDARPWWKNVGDYIEDPHVHFQLMDSLRTNMDWPEYIKARNN